MNVRTIPTVLKDINALVSKNANLAGHFTAGNDKLGD